MNSTSPALAATPACAPEGRPHHAPQLHFRPRLGLLGRRWRRRRRHSTLRTPPRHHRALPTSAGNEWLRDFLRPKAVATQPPVVETRRALEAAAQKHKEAKEAQALVAGLALADDATALPPAALAPEALPADALSPSLLAPTARE